MKLTTPINIPESTFKIEHQLPIMLTGSCFAASIGTKLNQYKFNTCINPFGIIYNPVSLSKALQRIVSNKQYREEELTLFNEKWLSFDHHGSYSSFDKMECLQNINNSIENANRHLQETQTLFITYGTAWTYEYPGFGIVGNCHKIPGKEFNKRLLTVNEITHQMDETLKTLKTFNPNLNIVLTVSPVRHIKDGIHENNLSKGTLLLAINNVVNQHANCHYFPAYEIVMDELRDYRFFKEDLVHPTEMAVNYVWEKFGETFFNEETQTLNKAIEKVVNGAQHIPFNKESEAHQKFTAVMLNTIKLIEQDFPFLDFTPEKNLLRTE